MNLAKEKRSGLEISAGMCSLGLYRPLPSFLRLSAFVLLPVSAR